MGGSVYVMQDAHLEAPMRNSKLVISAAIVLAACSSDQRPISR